MNHDIESLAKRFKYALVAERENLRKVARRGDPEEIRDNIHRIAHYIAPLVDNPRQIIEKWIEQ